jgi:molybdopterin molybdotransferase
MLNYPEALRRLLSAATPVAETEILPLERASGRVLAMPQYSTVDLPAQDNAAMDGYAARLADLSSPETCLPVSQRIPAGSVGAPLALGSVARIFTGAPIPSGAEAVVMQEYCEAVAAGVYIRRQPKAGENIRRAGEALKLGQTILEAGTRLRPQELALAASAGLATLPVWRRLKVAVFSTGDELHAPGETLPPGGLYDSNLIALASLLEGMGCAVENLGHIPDDLETTRAALRGAARDHDLILTSGGVSVGEEDHVRAAVQAEGHLDLWKVAIKPGKPLALGRIRKNAAAFAWFIGLPGNPVSLLVTFMALARYFVQALQGREVEAPRPYHLKAAFAWEKDSALHEFMRARRVGAEEVELFPDQGSGILKAMTSSDGLAIKPPHVLIQPGDRVGFLPYSELLS